MTTIPPDILAAHAQRLARDSTSLRSCEVLGALAKSNGLGSFAEEHVRALWNTALLRADQIVSMSPLELPGVELVSTEGSRYVYHDCRVVKRWASGYGSAFEAAVEESKLQLQLFFHPFRLFVLYHVERTLTVPTSSTQYLIYKDGVAKIAARLVQSLDQWTSGDSFGKRFDDWNIVAEVAIMLESVRQGTHPDQTAPADEAHFRRVHAWLLEIGRREVEDLRGELGMAAHALDENRNVHVLLRLMGANERTRLKGRLAGCMHFLAAAEVIRRVAEEALDQELPEEDELGPGQWMQGARRFLYGTDRVFDAPRKVLRDYLTVLDLDFGTKVRCYVEGATEVGALASALRDTTGIEFVNLKGSALGRGGKVVAFIESLHTDYRSHVISVVHLDGDRPDVVRALKKAIQDGHCFAPFFIATPDLEFANFSTDELLQIALDLAWRDDIDSERKEASRDELTPLLDALKGADAFFALLHRHGITQISKGEAWGEALMTYALAHEARPANHSRAGEERPLVCAAKLLVRARRAGFQRSISDLVVDPETGRPVAKVANKPS